MILRRLFPIARPALHAWFRWSRGLTLGVRAAVFDGEDRVCLVQHTYTGGWHLPGGGVEPGESVLEAMRRELDEEASLLPAGEPRLHGIFHSAPGARRDHVLVYVVGDYSVLRETRPGREIAAAGFFPWTDPPEGTTRGTRARLAEIRAGQAVASRW